MYHLLHVFFYILEVAVMNRYIPDSHVRPFEHSCLGRQKRDLLAFGIELIEALVGGFCSRQLLGRPRSSAHVKFAG